MNRAAVPNAGAKPLFRRILVRLLYPVLVRPSVRVMRALLAVAETLRRVDVGPGMPIIGEVVLDGGSDWRTEFTAAMWSVLQSCDAATDRTVWMICVGVPPVTLDDLYAIAVQAEPLVQLHLFVDRDEAVAFRKRYMPPASWREASGRTTHDVMEALSQIESRPCVFRRATAVRASAHTFVKQIGGDGLVLAVSDTDAQTVAAQLNCCGDIAQPTKLIVIGDPQNVPAELAEDPRVVIARRTGASLLEELALIRYCDGYVGHADHYAIMAADAGVPCLLSEPSAVSSHSSSHVWMTADAVAQFGRWLERLGGRQIETMPARTRV